MDSIDKSQIGAYIYDIQKSLSFSKNFSFEFTPRTANELAHSIATESMKEKKEFYLIGWVPKFAEKHADKERVRELD